MTYFQDPAFIRALYHDQDHITFRGNFLKRFSNRTHSLRDIALKQLSNPYEKRILDIGAGNGSFLRKVSETYPRNTIGALDVVSNEACRSIPGIQYRTYDGRRLPLDLGKWDVILLMHVLYHVADLEEFLSQIRSGLSDQGTLLISTKSKDTFHNLERVFHRIFSSYFPQVRISRDRDEAHFCDENGLKILEKMFPLSCYSIKEYPLETTITVDDLDSLIVYILSTPRYSHLTHGLQISEEEYICLWKKELMLRWPFVDSSKELLYVITNTPRV